MRAAPDGEPEHVLVLTTLGAPERRRGRSRRGAAVRQAEPEPVPTSRATVVKAQPMAGRADARAWLDQVRAHDEGRAEVDSGVAVLNRALHAHRAAKADPYARDVSADLALVVRIGFGSGDAVAEGRYEEAWEVPRGGRSRPRRSMEGPEERFAVLLGARESVLVCEELVLRARADLDQGRPREAALQARIALESLLAEIGEGLAGERRAALESDRAAISDAANAALRGPLPELSADAVEGAVARMETALRARRLGVRNSSDGAGD